MSPAKKRHKSEREGGRLAQLRRRRKEKYRRAKMDRERVEIDAKDGDESERRRWRRQRRRAARKAGRERFYLLTPPPAVVRARRDGLMRGRVHEKRNDDSGG